MNTRTLAILTIVMVIILANCQYVPGEPAFYVVEHSTYTAICSDTATLEQIETYVTRRHSESGQANGFIWQPESQCLTFDK